MTERPILSTEREKQILDLINTNYDYYMAAAHDIETRVRASTRPATPLAEFADFEKQSQHILNLGSHSGQSPPRFHGFLPGGLEAIPHLPARWSC